MLIIRTILYGLVVALLCVFLFYPFESDSYTSPYQDPKTYSIYKVLEKWGGGQWKYFNDIIYRESKWNHLAKNPKSSATGLGQFLNSTWELVGCEKTSDPYKQIDCTITYIEKRYGSPREALKFHQKHNYY